MKSRPIQKFSKWFSQARRAGTPIPEAMTLATASKKGRPSARIVLLKDASDKGFVFYTNSQSQKGRDLRQNSRAALVFYWELTDRQVRVEGKIHTVSLTEVDAYWKSRPRQSRLAARVSEQSQVLPRRDQLLKKYLLEGRRFKDKDIPRPKYWNGYRLIPQSIEFWHRGPHRLHRRELYTKAGKGWNRSWLQP